MVNINDGVDDNDLEIFVEIFFICLIRPSGLNVLDGSW